MTTAVTPEPTPAERLIAVAKAELAKNVREVGGANRGPDVEKYQATVGLTPPAPWCAAFVAWCVMTAKRSSTPPGWCSGSAVTQWHRATRKMLLGGYCTPDRGGFEAKVRPGMVWVRAKDGPSAQAARLGTWVQGHTGIVIAVDAEGFTTIEGNTNSSGSREGDGVYRKLHKWSYTTDIVRTIGWFDPEWVGRTTNLS